MPILKIQNFERETGRKSTAEKKAELGEAGVEAMETAGPGRRGLPENRRVRLRSFAKNRVYPLYHLSVAPFQYRIRLLHFGPRRVRRSARSGVARPIFSCMYVCVWGGEGGLKYKNRRFSPKIK